jgi:RNA polymerase sigma-70 factor, ECF subfamily
MSLEKSSEVIAVDDALRDLAKMDPRKSRIVEMRYFGGINIDEIAEILQLSPTTVQRQYRLAKAWLKLAIQTG